MNTNKDAQEHIRLLSTLKKTAEGLLENHSPLVWNVFGGLSRLHQAMEKILQHGCKIFTPEGDPDYLVFVTGGDTCNDQFIESEEPFPFPVHNMTELQKQEDEPKGEKEKASFWLRKCLQEHRMSSKLVSLLDNRRNLLSCYHPAAFLCQASYAEATLICLKAVEEYTPSLLTDISPKLFLSLDEANKSHRRSSSYPDTWRLHSVTNKLKRQSYSADLPNEFTEKTETKNTKPVITVTKAHNPDSELPFQKYCASRQRANSWELSRFSNCKYFNLSDRRRNTWHSEHDSSTSPHDHDGSTAALSVSPSVLKIDYTTSFTSGSPNEDCISVLPCGFINQSLSPKPRRNRSHILTNDVDTSSGELTKCEEVTTQVKSPRKIHHAHSKSDSGIIVQKPKMLYIPPIPASNSPLPKPITHSQSAHLIPSFVPEDKKVDKSANQMHEKRFMEDGGNSILPPATGFFPRPQQGQSLMSFLSSEFSRPSAELDRENAHFSISEALISAMEQMKCRRMLSKVDEAADESDEEIQDLQQRIRMRRRQKMKEKQSYCLSALLLSDGRTDTTTTDQSVTPPTSSDDVSSDSISTDDVDDYQMTDVTNLTTLRDSGLSISMASLYSEADLSHRTGQTCSNSVDVQTCQSPPTNSYYQMSPSAMSESITSAESVALSLLKRFSDKHLPKASDLEWLVSEQDAPQSLLPLPTSWPVDPDDVENDMSTATDLRGNLEWAPPRAQIICTDHPAVNRKVLLSRQNFRCAGCGMKVEIAYMKSFRYCHYLGKYFCTTCHSNKTALIPGKIMEKWDFRRYPVSKYSGRLLESMYNDPLFNPKFMNERICKKIRSIHYISEVRKQLFYMKDYLLNCRFAKRIAEELEKEPSHLLSDNLDIYSIHDFTQLKSGEILIRLKNLAANGLAHVKNCELCQARGFLCEMCKGNDIIFPFQFPKVLRCNNCLACFHHTCYDPGKCPKCTRIRARKEQVK